MRAKRMPPNSLPCRRRNRKYYANGGRAVIHLEDAPSDMSFSPQAHLAAVRNQHGSTRHLVVPKKTASARAASR